MLTLLSYLKGPIHGERKPLPSTIVLHRERCAVHYIPRHMTLPLPFESGHKLLWAVSWVLWIRFETSGPTL